MPPYRALCAACPNRGDALCWRPDRGAGAMDETMDAEALVEAAGPPDGGLVEGRGGVAMPPALAAALAAAQTYARQAHAAETIRAYRHDWLEFQDWCRVCRSRLANALQP